MYQLTTACICAAADTTGGNLDNLLFAGQILPEKDGGLNGTPALKLDSDWPFVAAVFTGAGPAVAARKAAYAAAASLKASGEKPTSDETLREMLTDAGTAVSVEAPGASVSVMAVSVTENSISLAGTGDCHAFLVREKELFLLSGTAVNAPGLPGAVSFSKNGKLRSGDQLLLCTDGLAGRIKGLELLKLLTAAEPPQATLKSVTEYLTPLQEGTVTAVLFSITEV